MSCDVGAPAAERAGVPHVVVASCAFASGFVDESRPGGAHSARKAELERLLDSRPGVARLRPCAVVGPGVEVDRWLSSPLVPPALPGRPWLPGPRLRVVHTEDVARVVPVPFRAAGVVDVAPGHRVSLVDSGRPRAPGRAPGAVVAGGRGTRGPLAPHRGPRWSRLGWGQPVHQSREGGSR